MSGTATRPSTEPTTTSEPCSWARRTRSAARATRNVPPTLVSSTRSKLASSLSSTRE